ncbi:hypothetical protein ACFQY7_32330 [Actinomadura luteofluorescens]|uniref:hypothetical protein n=1 Tax=Actinomadura luteofluorescens TaxID=46163 RepID=UPI0036423D68
MQRADGYGWLVGDEGSAVWLGKEAVRAALAAYDGRGSPTLLTDSVPRALLGATVVAQIDSERRRPRHPRALAMAGAPSPSPGPAVPPQSAALSAAGGSPGGRATGTAVLALESAYPPSARHPAHGGGPPGPHGPPCHPESPGTPPNPRLAQAIIKEVYGRPPAALGRLGPVVAAAAAAAIPWPGASPTRPRSGCWPTSTRCARPCPTPAHRSSCTARCSVKAPSPRPSAPGCAPVSPTRPAAPATEPSARPGWRCAASATPCRAEHRRHAAKGPPGPARPIRPGRRSIAMDPT